MSRLLLLFICSIFFIPFASSQQISTGPGIGYAFHSAMPMYSWHIGLEIDVKPTPFSIYTSMQIGTAQGNRNFSADPDLPYMIYSEHFENVFDDFNPYVGGFDPLVHLSIRTSITNQTSFVLTGRYAWFQKPKIKMASGFGLHHAAILKKFIVEEHHGVMNSYFNGKFEAVFPEPYFHRYRTTNAYVDFKTDFRINDRLSFSAILFYQHMKRFTGLLGVHTGLAIML